MMRTHVGVSPAGIFAILTPRGKVLVMPRGLSLELYGRIGAGPSQRSQSSPGSICSAGQVAPLARAADADRDGLDFPESPAPDDLGRLREIGRSYSTLLAPCLKDLVVFPRHVDTALRPRPE